MCLPVLIAAIIIEVIQEHNSELPSRTPATILVTTINSICHLQKFCLFHKEIFYLQPIFSKFLADLRVKNTFKSNLVTVFSPLSA